MKLVISHLTRALKVGSDIIVFRITAEANGSSSVAAFRIVFVFDVRPVAV